MARYDVVVVGAGPAGLSAALNAAVRQKSVLVLGSPVSEKLRQAPMIENYLGLPGESGSKLMAKFRAHVEQRTNVKFRDERVQVVYDMGEAIGLLLPQNEVIEARAVVLATGVHFGKLLPGEEVFLGRGVGYCATCDAALYRNRPVIVVGYNEESVQEANFIAEMASSTVFVNGMDREVALDEGIEEIRDTPLEVIGDSKVTGLRFADRDVEADGIFFLREARATDQFVPGIATDQGHVTVNASMETNLPGIFAAGDLVGLPYQINVAVGRGQIAGLSAAKHATLRREAERKSAEKA